MLFRNTLGSAWEYGLKKKKSHKITKVNKVKGRNLLEVMKEGKSSLFCGNVGTQYPREIQFARMTAFKLGAGHAEDNPKPKTPGL